MTSPNFITFVKQHYSPEANNIEEVILGLKTIGASQMLSVKALMTALGLSLKEADHLVINSEAWKERKEDVERFRNDLGEFLENLE